MTRKLVLKTSGPKYRRLMEIMRTRIQQGDYVSGAQFPTEHAWAKMCGLSRYTVRQAQDELEREGYLVRQQGRGTFVQMPPRRNGAGESREIGVLVPCITIALYPGVIRGVEDVCREADYHVIIGNYDAIPAKEERYISEMVGKPVAGMVICPSFNSSQSGYHQLLDRGLPFVLVDTMVDGIDADLVSTDNFWGARQGTQKLLGTGCQSIAFLCGHLTGSTSRERLAGCQAALKEQGMTLDQRRILEGPFSEDFGYTATQRLLASNLKIDGIFVANDPITVGVVRALREANRHIPDDIRVCTFDDPHGPMLHRVPLITVRQPRREAGRKAGEILLARIRERVQGTPPAPFSTVRLQAKVVSPFPSPNLELAELNS